jgi:hypothetical protein
LQGTADRIDLPVEQRPHDVVHRVPANEVMHIHRLPLTDAVGSILRLRNNNR